MNDGKLVEAGNLTAHMAKEIGMLFFALIFCMISLSMTMSGAKAAEAHKSGKYTYYLNGNNTIILTAYTGKDKKVVIPSTIDGYKVTRLYGVFQGNQTIRSVTVPNSVIYMDGTCDGCTNLKSIRLSGALKRIDGNTFRNCKKLKSITIPKSVNHIGGSAFQGSALVKAALPEKVKRIAQHAFANCSNLKQVTIKGKITEISAKTFYNCKKLESIILPETVKNIRRYAFMNCTALKKFQSPKALESIGTKSFANCKSLRSFTLGKNVQSIGDYAFLNCNALTSICGDDKNIVYGKGVFYKQIKGTYKDFAYYYYDKDEGIRLTSYKGNDKKVILPYEIDGRRVVKINAPLFKENTTIESLVIPDGYTTVPTEFCKKASKLQKVQLSGQMKIIPQGMFEGCSSLSEISGANGITEVKNWAFKGCSALMKYPFPDQLLFIGSGAFAECIRLNHVKLGTGVCSIGLNAFAWCRNLTDFSCENPDAVMGMDILRGTPLASVIYPYDVKGMNTLEVNGDEISLKQAWDPDEAMYVQPVDSLREITIHAKKAYFDYNGLAAYRNLEKLTISKDCELTIHKGAFYGNNKLTEVTLPGNTREMKGAFLYCQNLNKISFAGENDKYQIVDGCVVTREEKPHLVLVPADTTSFVVPDNIAVIDTYAFANCSRLKSVSLNEGLESIEEGAFAGCSLKSLNIPKSVKEIGMYIVANNNHLTSLSVEKGNTHFKANGTALWDKKEKALIAEIAVKGICEVPEGIERIYPLFVANTDKVKKYSFPSTMRYWRSARLYGAKKLTFKSVDPPEIDWDRGDYQLIESNGELIYDAQGNPINADNSDSVKRTLYIPKKYQKNYDNWLKYTWGYPDRDSTLTVKTY